MRKRLIVFISILALCICSVVGCEQTSGMQFEQNNTTNEIISLNDIPDYSGNAYIAINDNIPYFTQDDITTESFEFYSPLDNLGRCQEAFANIGTDIMPTEDRGSISQVKPSGWQSVKYDFVDGKYLYNRCHLIGFQLTGENANEENLITGTRYLNIEGMLPFENMTADYVIETGNHVLYRATPIFEGENLLANGVLLEGYSVEDKGEGICFCIYAYNVQPGVNIDYATGESWISTEGQSNVENVEYILNTNTKKFHIPDCASVKNINKENMEAYSGSRDNLINMGYTPCGQCNP